MIDAIKGLVSSKKFWLTIIGSAVYAVLVQIGVPEETAFKVLGMFGLNVLGQAYADGGKEALKEQRRLEAETRNLTPSKRAAALREAAGVSDEDDLK
jgi:hypothetical protein